MTNQFSRRNKKERPTTAKEALTPKVRAHERKITVNLDVDLHHQFRMLVMDQKRTLQEVVTEMITTYVDKHSR